MRMKKEHKAFKFFLPLFVTVYSVVILLPIVFVLDNISEQRWYYYVIEVALYIAVISATYFLTKKLYTKLFSESAAYQIGKVDFRTAAGILLCVFALFVTQHRVLYECFMLNNGTITPAQDMETIPEILLLSISSVFLAPVLEELIFRRCLSVYKSTRGKITALIIISALFGILHIHSPYSAAVAAVNGALFGVFFLKTKKLIVPILMHIGVNACNSFFGIMYDLGVGGIELNNSPAIWCFKIYWLVAAVLAAAAGFILLKSNREDSGDKGDFAGN